MLKLYQFHLSYSFPSLMVFGLVLPAINLNAQYPGVTSDGANGIVVAGKVEAGGTYTTVNSGTLAAAEAILPSGGTLVVNNILTVASNYSTNKAIKYEVKNGGGFNISSGATLSLDSPLEAGRYTVFTGSGTVSFAGNSYLRELFPEWWGADPTGTTPSAVAWNAAVVAAGNVNGFGGLVSCPTAVYNIENTITSFSAASTANGVSLRGPDGQNNGASGSCSLKWTGPSGGTLFHYLGGHSGKIDNINFNANSTAARALWLDSNNSATAASSTITSITRSGSVVTATLASAESWPSGTDVVIAGVVDTSYNGIFPVWYQTDSTHIAWSQGGTNSSSSGGTAAVVVGGDISGLTMHRDFMWVPTSSTSSITSCSIASNTLSCTLASPVILYPNQWTWITGSSDPNYNAYWQILTVTSPTTFTANAVEIPSEAATTSGTFWGQSTGTSFGSNELALVNNSVCCTNIEESNAHGASATSALMGWEWDGRGNTKDFNFKHIGTEDFRIAFGLGSQQSGQFSCDDCSGDTIADAVWASPVIGPTRISNSQWEQTSSAYVFANLLSGSFEATTLGTNGQFEVEDDANQSVSLIMTGNSFEMGPYASDGVAIATPASLILEGNTFDEIYVNQNVVLSVATATPGSGQTPGTYALASTGGGGTGAIIVVTVAAGGTVTTAPYVQAQGSGYTSAPTFMLSAGGTPATFTPTIGLPTPLLAVATNVNGNNPVGQTVTSIGNTYLNVPSLGWIPIYGQPFTAGSPCPGNNIITFGDKSSTVAAGQNLTLSSCISLSALNVPSLNNVNNVTLNGTTTLSGNAVVVPTAVNQGVYVEGYGANSADRIFMVDNGGYSSLGSNKELLINNLGSGNNLVLESGTNIYEDAPAGGYAINLGVQNATEQINLGSGSSTDTLNGIVKVETLQGFGTPSASGCSLTSLVGGYWVGQFASGTTGTCTVTITQPATATHGYFCRANDLTTPTDTLAQTASSTTTCTLSGTTVTGDVINWMAVAY